MKKVASPQLQRPSTIENNNNTFNMARILFASILLLFSTLVLSSPLTYDQANLSELERHLIQHDHKVRCLNCYCGANGLAETKHHCPSNRDVLLCPSTVEICYRCSCEKRMVVKPSPVTSSIPTASPNGPTKPSVPFTTTPSISKPQSSLKATPSMKVMPITPEPSHEHFEDECVPLKRKGGGRKTVFEHELGAQSGKFGLIWRMNRVPDKLVIEYEGRVIFTTETAVSGRGSAYLDFSGMLSKITVAVSAPTGATGWSIEIGCAEEV